MVTDMAYLHFAFAIQQVLKYALESKEWVVIICPDPKTVMSCSRYVASSLPSHSSFSGRTALLPGGGHLSVVAAQDDIFPPLDVKPFSTAFVGWESRDSGMTKWHDLGTKTFKFAV